MYILTKTLTNTTIILCNFQVNYTKFSNEETGNDK